MALIDIPTLNGAQVHVAADSVFRVTRGIGADAKLTRVDYGSQQQLTHMPEADVVGLLKKAGAKFIGVTAPDGTAVYLAVKAITAIRDPDPHFDPPNAKAVVCLGKPTQAVQQTAQQLKDLITAAG